MRKPYSLRMGEGNWNRAAAGALSRSAMTHEDKREASDEVIELPAEKARGGEIVLRTRAMRIIFIAGLAAFVLIILFVSIGGRG
jgi:hypothetical protein